MTERRIIRPIALAASLIAGLWAAQAGADCRQALALGLDVSGSVDSREYRVQLDGLANALLDPEVQAAFLALPDHPARLAVFEWSGPDLQRPLIGWTDIRTASDIASVAASIRGAARLVGDPSTAIGSAMQHGFGLLSQQAGCWRRTLDISGDGKSNTGPRPKSIQPAFERADITINGLVIGSMQPESGGHGRTEMPDLWSYYSAYVITGPGAFVESALGFEDFERAMVRKLKRELQGQLFSSLAPPR